MKPKLQKTALLTLGFDAGPEAHFVLTEKIFPRQATVLTVDAFIAEQEDN